MELGRWDVFFRAEAFRGRAERPGGSGRGGSGVHRAREDAEFAGRDEELSAVRSLRVISEKYMLSSDNVSSPALEKNKRRKLCKRRRPNGTVIFYPSFKSFSFLQGNKHAILWMTTSPPSLCTSCCICSRVHIIDVGGGKQRNHTACWSDAQQSNHPWPGSLHRYTPYGMRREPFCIFCSGWRNVVLMLGQ